MQTTFLSVLILILIILTLLGLTVYYFFNKEKVNDKILGDSSHAYKQFFNK